MCGLNGGSSAKLYPQNSYTHPSEIQCNAATEISNLKTSVSNGKSAIASAITGKGVSTASDATFQTMANNIMSISATVPLKYVRFTPNQSSNTTISYSMNEIFGALNYELIGFICTYTDRTSTYISSGYIRGGGSFTRYSLNNLPYATYVEGGDTIRVSTGPLYSPIVHSIAQEI